MSHGRHRFAKMKEILVKCVEVLLNTCLLVVRILFLDVVGSGEKTELLHPGWNCMKRSS